MSEPSCVAGTPRISVAMATYNGARYVREQLESIKAQTLQPCEIIITDDQSSDDTADVVKAFAETAPFPVTFTKNERRLGYVDNFFRAMRGCQGDLIALCDQDDWWMPNKLEVCARVFENPDVQLAVHTAEIVDGELKPLGQQGPSFPQDKILAPLHMDPFWCPPGFAMVFRADVFRPFKESERPSSHISDRLPHDHWILFTARVLGSVAQIAEPLAKYRRHGNNVTDLPPSGVQELMAGSKSAGQERYQQDATLMRDYAEFWRRHLDSLPADRRGRAEAAISFYQACARRFEGRARLYGRGQGMGRRALILAQHLASGSYRPRETGGLGLRSLLKDLYTVARGPA